MHVFVKGEGIIQGKEVPITIFNKNKLKMDIFCPKKGFYEISLK